MHRHLVPVKTSREKHEAMDFFLKHVLELRIFVLKRRIEFYEQRELNRAGQALFFPDMVLRGTHFFHFFFICDL